jgi:ketosteroid isomerase-like protein
VGSDDTESPDADRNCSGFHVSDRRGAGAFLQRHAAATDREPSDRQDVRRVHPRILTSDARGLAALFTVDGYLLPPHVPAAKGQSAIQQGYETHFRGPVKITEFAISHIEATIQGDLVFSAGTYTQRLLLSDGKPSATPANPSRFSSAFRASGSSHI